MHSIVIQCKQAAYTSILTKVGNGRHVDVRAWPRPSRSAWAEMNGFLYKDMGKLQMGHNSNCKA